MDNRPICTDEFFRYKTRGTLRKYRIPRGIITVLKGSGTTRDRVPITSALLNAKAKSRRVVPHHRPFWQVLRPRISHKKGTRNFNYASPAPVEIPMLTRWGNPTRFFVA